MKKTLALILSFVIAVAFLSGCKFNAGEFLFKKNAELPIDEPVQFVFSSGAGAWMTYLQLEKDGSFVGSFHDSNMGEIGEGYPGGTCYICNFSGKFEIGEKISDTAYEMTLSEIETEAEEGTEWIEEDVLYIASSPYGIEGGTEFIFYTPDTELKDLPDEFLWWWPLRFTDEIPEKLDCYGIHNVNTNDGFFTYE